MEKQAEVMTRSMELTVASLEALEHILLRLNAGDFEETLYLMDDVVSGFYQMEQSLQVFMAGLPDSQIEGSLGQVRNRIAYVVSAYEQGIHEQVIDGISNGLLPDFKQLNIELEAAFKPYLVS